MIIERPELVENTQSIQYRVNACLAGQKATLWYSLDKKFGDMVSESSDAALVGLLIPAMALGEDIHVTGQISERIYYSLSGPYQQFICLTTPQLSPDRIRADNLIFNPTDQGQGTATGFSGGVDSFCVLADHLFSNIPDSARITHLLFNNVGGHTERGGVLFKQRFGKLKPFAEKLDLPYIAVNSNLDEWFW